MQVSKFFIMQMICPIMKRTTAFIFLIATIFIALIIAVFCYEYMVFYKEKESALLNETLTIASWNMQIFGDKKASDVLLMRSYASIISKYDIVFVQEIRDSDGSSFSQLCSMLPDHACFISGRAGRSSSKEQYGVVYLKTLNISFYDYTPDSMDRWERPPLRAVMHKQNYSLNIYSIHIRPDAAPAELSSLEKELYSVSGNIILMGDLNADCNYYDVSRKDFRGWKWIISDNDDTTVSSSDCAYDRIILNSDAYNEFVGYGIYKNINEELSDHYLIWLRIRDKEHDSDKGMGLFLSWMTNKFIFYRE